MSSCSAVWPARARLSPVLKPSDRAFATPFRIESLLPGASLPVVVDGIPLARAISIAACVGSDEAFESPVTHPQADRRRLLPLRSIEHPGRARDDVPRIVDWSPSSFDDARAWSTVDGGGFGPPVIESMFWNRCSLPASQMVRGRRN